MCELDEDFKKFLETQPKGKLKPPLAPKDAMFGGWVNCIKTHYEVGPEEKIHYFDITSLYPWCCMTQEYPIGVPTIIKSGFDKDLGKYFSLVYCEVSICIIFCTIYSLVYRKCFIFRYYLPGNFAYLCYPWELLMRSWFFHYVPSVLKISPSLLVVIIVTMNDP